MNDVENMEEKQVEMWKDMKNMEERQIELWKHIEKYGRKASWIVKR